MKFNIEEIYNSSKDNTGFNTLTKYILVFSCVLGLLSLLTLLPLNNLNFFLDMFGYVCRYGSVILFVILFKNNILLIMKQFTISKNIYLILGIILLVVCTIIYLVCFSFNIIGLFF